MTTQKSLRRPLAVAKIYWLLFLVVSIIGICSVGFAQENRIVTLIPTDIKTEGSNCVALTILASRDEQPLCSIRLSFKTSSSSSFPAGANVTAAHLLLVGTVNATQTITATTGDNQLFGEITPDEGKYFPTKDLPTKRARWSAKTQFLNWLKPVSTKAEKGFSLVLTTKSRGLKSEWSWQSTDAFDKSSLGPRLILEYTVPGRAPVVQSEGVAATHSPKKFLPDPSAGAQYGTVDVTTGNLLGNLFSYEPVFFNGLVYLITNDNQLRALFPLGRLVWSVPLTDPGQHLLVSESGRLYIVGKGKILVYQLDPSNPFTQATEVKTSGGQSLILKAEFLYPTLAPTVGADGSLYFVNGMEVYGLNPDLQQLWKVTLGDTLTSPVTVGPSGQFVYLTAKKQGLVAINAQTGETFINPLPNQDLFTSLHAPVVIRHPDGPEKIYVAANSAEDGVLAAFDNFKTVPGKGETKTIAPVENWPSPTGVWSQPIIDQLPPADPPDSKTPNLLKTIYAVNNGTLTAIDWLKGSTTKTVAVQLESPNGSSLASDVHGNLLEDDSRVLFGSDGTLYKADPKDANNRSLRAIVPQYTLSAQGPTKVSSPTHLRVNGILPAKISDKDVEATLSAGGSVIVGTGFSVTRGATLKISTGVP